jgi:hypothetical protein
MVETGSHHRQSGGYTRSILNLLPSIVALGLAALAALHLALSRRSPPEKVAERSGAARALALAVGLQSVHFAEEAATGFHERFGAVFGLPGMPLTGFVIFNLAWLGIWLASIPGLRSARTFAFFAAWFLAIAGMLNGIAHPLLAVAEGGYFPGVVSSPLIGAASVLLWLRLRRATHPQGGY